MISSQGNDSYVVLDAQPPYALRGAFRVGVNAEAGIDGASETDGLEVTSANLGGPFTQGMLVVQGTGASVCPSTVRTTNTSRGPMWPKPELALIGLSSAVHRCGFESFGASLAQSGAYLSKE